jgi:hypothetical protein
MKYLKKFNESTLSNINSEKKESFEQQDLKMDIINTLKKVYQSAINVYNTLMKEGSDSKGSIDRRIESIDNYFEENRHIDLKSIINGSRKISESQSSPYYVGGIMVYLDKTAFRSAFYDMVNEKTPNFDNWYQKENIEQVINKIIESYN